ncbi:MAG: hypothetical protein ABIK44_06390 [candidate division WOR-3 bacterium]
MAEVCVKCGQRRPSRLCPPLGGLICSQCCGQSRRRTVDCPDECRFFLAGWREAVGRLVQFAGDWRFEREWFDVLNNLRLVLVRTRFRLVSNLDLALVRSALTSVAEMIRARMTGLIYETSSPVPGIQSIIDELTWIVESHEHGKKGLRPVAASDLLSCLLYLERQLRCAADQGKDGKEVFDILAQSVSRTLIGSGVSDNDGPIFQRGPGLVS